MLHKEEWGEVDKEVPGKLFVPRGHNVGSVRQKLAGIFDCFSSFLSVELTKINI